MNLKTFKMWEMAANSVGGGGVSMPADVQHNRKKKKKVEKRTVGVAKKDNVK